MHKDKLHKLLHSLSPAEIKFFRLYARRHFDKSKAAYLRLFDLCLKENHHQEETIRKKISPALSKPGYSSLKKYLYDLVLKSLVIQRSETSTYASLLQELGAAEVLAEKQLFDESLLRLNKVKAAAKDNEMFCLALSAAWFEEIVMLTTGYTFTDSSSVSARHDSMKKMIRQIQAAMDLNSLFADYARLNRGGLLTETDQQQLQELFRNPLIQNGLHYDMGTARRGYWILKMVEARFHRKNDEALSYLLKIYEQCTGYPPDFYFHENLLITASSMLIFAYLQQGQAGEAMAVLQKLKGMKPAALQNQYMLFRSTFLIELMVCRYQKNHQGAMQLINGYESSAKKFRNRSFNILEYRNYQTIIAYLIGTKQPAEALPFIHAILNDPSTKDKGILFQLYARILSLIVHFELRNADLLESSLRSLEYFLQTNAVQFKFIGHVVRFFKTAQKLNGNISDALKTLAQSLQALGETPVERIHLFDLVDCGWLQSKGIELNIPGPRPMVM
jgi:hypothetical protein